MRDSIDSDEIFGTTSSNRPTIENEKENQTKSKRLPRTKKEQFCLIKEFYKDNNEELLDSDTIHQLWNELVNKLNSIGPPSRSITEWKKVWSEHKYNKKRKRPETEGPNLSIKKTAPITPLQQTQNQYVQPPVKISTVDDVNHQSIVLNPNKPFGEFIVQLPTLPDENEYSDQDLFISSDDSFFNVLDNLGDQVNATSDVLCDIQPMHSTLQQNQLSSILSENEIGQKLSEIVKKLDVVITHQVQAIDLLKELIKKK